MVWSRRGHGGTKQVRGQGLIAAAFRHRTSRNGDPHLHTHVLVPNMVLAEDGKWATLDARWLYTSAQPPASDILSRLDWQQATWAIDDARQRLLAPAPSATRPAPQPRGPSLGIEL